MYLFIVIFLLCLAVFDLFVGVSNDAVNFLQSAVGARVARFRTVLIVASLGVLLGAVMSSGMMDVARHGIMTPTHYSFADVMVIFMAVMVTDVIVLDVFNTLGMPTSTTVSLVFELLGGTFVLASIKILGDPALEYGMLLNSDKALQVIIAIFVSVAIAFVAGMFIMWLSRVVFTFNYRRHSRYSIAVFGGIAFTALAYFIFLKGLGKSPYVSADTREYIDNNTSLLLAYVFIGSTALMQVFHLMRINIFKLVVLMGTFALAMAFASNDLVNFIGVPLAGLDSYNDFVHNANGAGTTEFMMNSLMESAKTPPFYLMLAGAIMIIAMVTSKKAQNVIKTSVDLSRQDEGDEMFGSSAAARSVVRSSQNMAAALERFIPTGVQKWINSRFNQADVVLEDEKAAFDVVRAAVNLVIASMLITIGTNLKLPLSTTYVTFMVAMGSSLADRAWSRESAVFRVTGVLSVIGGWFLTAGIAFMACALVALVMYFGGVVAMAGFMVLVVYLLVKSQRKYNKKSKSEKEANNFQLMMRMRDPELVWDLLHKHVSTTQSHVNRFVLNTYNRMLDALEREDTRTLRQCRRELKAEKDALKKYRRQEMLGLKRSPTEISAERNTWFHLGANSNQQFVYCLRRMHEPILEHVENHFNPIPKEYIEEFAPFRRQVNALMKSAANQLETSRFDDYRTVLDEADVCKDQLSKVREKHIERMRMASNKDYQINLVYLNVVQETQELLSVMRHQLRAAKMFVE